MAVKNTIHRFIGFLSRKSHLRCRAWTRYIPDAKCQRGLYESHRQLIKHCSSALGQSLKFASLPHSPDDSQSPLRFTWQLIRGGFLFSYNLPTSVLHQYKIKNSFMCFNNHKGEGLTLLLCLHFGFFFLSAFLRMSQPQISDADMLLFYSLLHTCFTFIKQFQ